MTYITELEMQIAELQQKLEEEKKKAKARRNPWKLTEVGKEGFFVNDSGIRINQGTCYEESDISTSITKEAAEGFLNVWHVMAMLRQQEGAGTKDEDACGWITESCGTISAFQSTEFFSLCPPFPSPELAEAARDTVGIDRIIAAYKFLATGE